MPDPNKFFNVRLNGEGKLRILLSQKTGASISTPGLDANKNRRRQLGTIKSHRKPDELIPKRVTTGKINFYDLGQVRADEDYLDIEFSQIPVITFIGPGAFAADSLTSPQWDDLHDLIFTYPVGEWTSRYKKLGLVDAKYYGLDVLDTDVGEVYPVAQSMSRPVILGYPANWGRWASDGLTIDSDLTHFQLMSYGAFQWWDNDPANFKFTTTPSFAGTEVPFSFQVDTAYDVFLMPDIMLIGGFSGAGPDELLISTARHLRRDTFLTMPHDDGSGDTFLMYNLSEQLDAANQSVLKEYARFNGQLFDHTDGSVLDPATFPNGTGPFIRTDDFGGFTVELRSGTFVGAIKKNGTFYYIWNKNDGYNITTVKDIALDL